MVLFVSPTQSQMQIALCQFLQSVLPPGTPVIMMQDNQVPEPQEGNFVALNPVRRLRFATNIASFTDLVVLGSIVGTTMHVDAVAGGPLVTGLPVLGANVAAGTLLGVQQSGPPGGVGDYLVAPSQSLPAQQQFTLGTVQELQKTDLVMQADFHGPLSSDAAQITTTMFRDSYAVDFFAALPYDVVPLYPDEPRQLPFINAEQNWETRWSVDLHLEANQTVYNVPQQYAASLQLDLISVDAAYPV